MDYVAEKGLQKKEEEAYNPELCTSDVVAVLNDLGIAKTPFWGYSMGGRIAFQLIRYHPSRFSSYIIGAASATAGFTFLLEDDH